MTICSRLLTAGASPRGGRERTDLTPPTAPSDRTSPTTIKMTPARQSSTSREIIEAADTSRSEANSPLLQTTTSATLVDRTETSSSRVKHRETEQSSSKTPLLTSIRGATDSPAPEAGEATSSSKNMLHKNPDTKQRRTSDSRKSRRDLRARLGADLSSLSSLVSAKSTVSDSRRWSRSSELPERVKSVHRQPASPNRISSYQQINQMLEDLEEIFSDKDSLPIRATTFSPDGSYFAVGTNSKKLMIYSIESIINSFVPSPHDRTPSTPTPSRSPRFCSSTTSTKDRSMLWTGQ